MAVVTAVPAIGSLPASLSPCQSGGLGAYLTGASANIAGTRRPKCHPALSTNEQTAILQMTFTMAMKLLAMTFNDGTETGRFQTNSFANCQDG